MATARSATPRPAPEACVDESSAAVWSARQTEAWIGLLETHKHLTRTLDAELESRHGLSLSGVELLDRLAAAPDRCLRLSWLAAEAGLSLSRVSRIAVVLETRGLIERAPCESDARAVEARLTPAGRELAGQAQETHFATVQRLFFDQLAPAEVEVLADVFGRLAPRAAERCTAPGPARATSASAQTSTR